MISDFILGFGEFNKENFATIIMYVKIVLITFSLIMTFWTLYDISSRTQNIFVRIFATLTVAFFNIIGLVLYILFRPRETVQEKQYRDLITHHEILTTESNMITCSSCYRLNKDSFTYCVLCGHSLAYSCKNCGKQVDPSWTFCAYCKKELHPELSIRERLGIIISKPREILRFLYRAFTEYLEKTKQKKQEKDNTTNTTHNEGKKKKKKKKKR
jgi:hypothetical protein